MFGDLLQITICGTVTVNTFLSAVFKLYRKKTNQEESLTSSLIYELRAVFLKWSFKGYMFSRIVIILYVKVLHLLPFFTIS